MLLSVHINTNPSLTNVEKYTVIVKMYKITEKSTIFIILVVSIVVISEANPLPHRAHEFVRNRGYGRLRREIGEMHKESFNVLKNDETPNFEKSVNDPQIEQSTMLTTEKQEIPTTFGYQERERSHSKPIQVNIFRRDETIIAIEVNRNGKLRHQIIKEELDSKKFEPRWT